MGENKDMLVIGGGISKQHEKFIPLLTVEVDVVPAELRNQAGIVGAAASAMPAGSNGP